MLESEENLYVSDDMEAVLKRNLGVAAGDKSAKASWDVQSDSDKWFSTSAE